MRKTDDGGSGSDRQVLVWDLPTRLFHGLLVVLVAVSVYTGNVGGLRLMDWHLLSGYAILALVLFRVAWGFAGSTQSRFASFVHGPSVVLAYARDLGRGVHRPAIGHNPLGGWSVMAMLACLLIQASTGLFADDAILTEGPLADSVPTATSKLLTGIHVLNAKVLYALIALHLAAIAYHGLVARENLVRPMITGAKRLPAAAVAGDRTAPGLLAAVLAALAAAAVAWIVDG